MCQIFDRQEWTSHSLPAVYERTMDAVLTFLRHLKVSDVDLTAAKNISKSILLLDMKPDTWKKLQFAHISYFPVIDW